MFRSEDMSLNRVMFAKESMWQTMNHLAYSEKVMFTYTPEESTIPAANQLSNFSAKMVKRCEELTTNLLDIEKSMTEFSWPIFPYTKPAKSYIEDLDTIINKEMKSEEFFESEEKSIIEKYERLNGLLSSRNKLVEQRTSLLENKMALGAMEEIVPVEFARLGQWTPSNSQIGLGDSGLSVSNKRFYSVLGLVPTANMFKLHRLLFRISRNNVMLKSKSLQELNDNLLTGEKAEQKTLVFIIFPKTDGEVFIDKVNTVLKYHDFINLELANAGNKQELLVQLDLDLEDNFKVINKSTSEINELLKFYSERQMEQDCSYINVLKLIVRREENFARHLLYLEEMNGFYQLYIWLPQSYKETLYNEMEQMGSTDVNFTKPKIIEVETEDWVKGVKVPTYFRLNEFTKPFQLIVDTYGVPNYKEANPGLFTIISFPFLFGLMFGDVGHGLMLLMAGIYLCCFLKDKISILNDLKYLVLLMGIFAVYCGLVYNEFFSVPFLTQPSCYMKTEDGKGFERKSPDCTYAFGMDWIWAQSANETSYINSFKMKFSIVIGVVQMLFGILLKGANGISSGHLVDFWFEALPQFIFMAVTFGYMSFCIIIKWLTNWEGRDPVSIIQLFINFVSVDEPLYGSAQLQETIQIVFVFLCFICMFLMLIPKPVILHRRALAAMNQENPEAIDSVHDNLIEENKGEEEHEGFGELFVHQMIETIEFVLGSVSNTASYLRLWALSLAHGQLAKVFLNMIFGFAITDSNGVFSSFIVIIFGFVFFSFVTLAVILLMDSMECFLHALRLHWVEFQNKFYKGDGLAFRPFKHNFIGDEVE